MNTPGTSSGTLSKLVGRYEVAERTMAFRFEKPPGWTFQAGQFLDLTLVAPSETDAEGDSRAFSIASGPQEDTLMVATRLRDTAFKRVLQTVPLGTAVKLAGPSGTLTLHPDVTRAAVFLAGGIGITPFRSMLLRAAQAHLPQRIVLFYSNRRPEDAPFLDELQALGATNPYFTLIASMTEMGKSQRPWHGETGQINASMLARYLKNAGAPIYYIAGPPGMVKGLHAMVRAAGVDKADIRAEEFGGY